MGNEGSEDSTDHDSAKNLGRMARQTVAFARVRVHFGHRPQFCRRSHRLSPPSNAHPCPIGWGRTEGGCVRRTSRSRTEEEDVLKHCNALLPALTLRLGPRPQSRSDRWSGGARRFLVSSRNCKAVTVTRRSPAELVFFPHREFQGSGVAATGRRWWPEGCPLPLAAASVSLL